MNADRHDLSVAYRIYPKMSANPPPIFETDKLKLAELCLTSFKRSLGGVRAKLWVLLNECPPEFETLFTDLWDSRDLVLLRYPGIPPGATLQEQVRLMLHEADTEFIYLAEDDYFYLPGQFASVVEFLRNNPDADFASPYDHPDLDALDLHKAPREERTFQGRTWRSCMSNTHTFMARRSSFVEVRRVFEELQPGRNYDLAMWMALTKKRVFNPVKLIKWTLQNRRYWAGSIALAWWHFGRQVLAGRRYSLWVPKPAIATHMLAGLEAPGLDWQEEFARLMNRGSQAVSKRITDR